MNQVVHAEALVLASADAVFALIADESTWPAWSPIASASLDTAAPAGPPGGVGAVRCFRTGRVTSIEEVVAVEAPRRFAYELRSGLPLRDYHAEITLEPEGTATRVTWHSEFTPELPGTGWFYRRVLQRFLTQMVSGLAAAFPVPAAV